MPKRAVAENSINKSRKGLQDKQYIHLSSHVLPFTNLCYKNCILDSDYHKYAECNVYRAEKWLWILGTKYVVDYNFITKILQINYHHYVKEFCSLGSNRSKDVAKHAASIYINVQF